MMVAGAGVTRETGIVGAGVGDATIGIGIGGAGGVRAGQEGGTAIVTGTVIVIVAGTGIGMLGPMTGVGGAGQIVKNRCLDAEKRAVADWRAQWVYPSAVFFHEVLVCYATRSWSVYTVPTPLAY